MGREELAWAAGFFDGEGSCYIAHGSQPWRKPYIRLAASQKDIRPLQRLLTAVGIGYLYYEHRGYWTWRVRAQGSVVTAIWRLWPYLSDPKKEQIRRAMIGANVGNYPNS